MVDIDHFKAYNDTHGHLAGDAALRAVAQLLKVVHTPSPGSRRALRGDEFVAVLYDLPQERVQEMAERLRRSVHDDAAAGAIRQIAPITISIGAGVIVPGEGRSMQGAVQLADEALYEASRAVAIASSSRTWKTTSASIRARFRSSVAVASLDDSPAGRALAAPACAAMQAGVRPSVRRTLSWKQRHRSFAKQDSCPAAAPRRREPVARREAR